MRIRTNCTIGSLRCVAGVGNGDKKSDKSPCRFRELAGARTRDPNIKSVVLYLLSYEFIVPK